MYLDNLSTITPETQPELEHCLNMCVRCPYTQNPYQSEPKLMTKNDCLLFLHYYRLAEHYNQELLDYYLVFYLDRVQEYNNFPFEDMHMLKLIFKHYHLNLHTYFSFWAYYEILQESCECPITLEYTPLSIRLKVCNHCFGANIFRCDTCPLCRTSIFNPKWIDLFRIT